MHPLINWCSYWKVPPGDIKYFLSISWTSMDSATGLVFLGAVRPEFEWRECNWFFFFHTERNYEVYFFFLFFYFSLEKKLFLGGLGQGIITDGNFQNPASWCLIYDFMSAFYVYGDESMAMQALQREKPDLSPMKSAGQSADPTRLARANKHEA